MRESNFSFMSQNKASVGVTSGLYDRRALDCTSTLPLINSLTHLSYLTSSSARIREIVTVDGGVERLATILKSSAPSSTQSPFAPEQFAPTGSPTQPHNADILTVWKWTLAFQCMVNIGVRGSEAIRTRVVEAGMVPIIASILDNYLHTLESMRVERQKSGIDCALAAHLHQQNRGLGMSLSDERAVILPTRPASPVTPSYSPSNRASHPLRREISRLRTSAGTDSEDVDLDSMNAATLPAVSHPPHAQPSASSTTGPIFIGAVVEEGEQAVLSRLSGSEDSAENASETFAITHHPSHPSLNVSSASPRLPANAAIPSPPAAGLASDSSTPTSPQHMLDSAILLLPREEDVVLSLQLLAYVSKYPSLRDHFQQSHLVKGLSVKYPDSDPENQYVGQQPINIFPLVERFTIRNQNHSQEMQYWSGVIMRNSCRKDDARGGIRQCAFFHCGKWEEFPRQFSKCRRCRRTKYCSKMCQSKAWSHHRFWCVETAY